MSAVWSFIKVSLILILALALCILGGVIIYNLVPYLIPKINMRVVSACIVFVYCMYQVAMVISGLERRIRILEREVAQLKPSVYNPYDDD